MLWQRLRCCPGRSCSGVLLPCASGLFGVQSQILDPIVQVSHLFQLCLLRIFIFNVHKNIQSLHEIKRSDSGEKLTAVTSALWCPCRQCFRLKFLVFHMMIVLSVELVASHFESGLNAQHSTLSSCPVSVSQWAPTNGFFDEDPPMFATCSTGLLRTTPSVLWYYNQPHPPLSMRACIAPTPISALRLRIACATIVTESVRPRDREMATQNYRHRAYHKTGYQIPATSYPVASATAIPLEKNHRIVAHFAQPGIERNAGATGFAYGSEKSYTNFREGYRECRHRLDDRT